MLGKHPNPEGEKAMMNDETTKNIIDNVINSVDFSKVCYLKKDDIDFSAFDLHEVPSADFTCVDSVIKELEEKIPYFEYSVQHSKLREENKNKCLKNFSWIKEKIDDYRKINTKGDVQGDKYDDAFSIRSILEDDLLKSVPKSIQNDINNCSYLIRTSLDQIRWNVKDRSYFLDYLSRKLIDESEKHQIELHKNEIFKTGLTIENIKNAKSEEYLDAACQYMYEKFGSGATAPINAIRYNNGSDIPEIHWLFEKEVEPCIKSARYLGLKEIAFVGDSTAALSNLNIITKLGLNFRIEEITKECRYGNKDTHAAAIVQL
jgi:hypothetical protein